MGPADLEALSIELTVRMLVLAGVAHDEADAHARVRRALDSGAGVEKFRELVAAQGGDPCVIDDYGLLPQAPVTDVWRAPAAGVVASMDAEAVGRAAVALGAGRDRADAGVDYAAGIDVVALVGTRVGAGDAVLRLHTNEASRLPAARALLDRGVIIGEATPPAGPLVLDRIDGRAVAARPH